MNLKYCAYILEWKLFSGHQTNINLAIYAKPLEMVKV